MSGKKNWGDPKILATQDDLLSEVHRLDMRNLRHNSTRCNCPGPDGATNQPGPHKKKISYYRYLIKYKPRFQTDLCSHGCGVEGCQHEAKTVYCSEGGNIQLFLHGEHVAGQEENENSSAADSDEEGRPRGPPILPSVKKQIDALLHKNFNVTSYGAIKVIADLRKEGLAENVIPQSRQVRTCLLSLPCSQINRSQTTSSIIARNMAVTRIMSNLWLKC